MKKINISINFGKDETMEEEKKITTKKELKQKAQEMKEFFWQKSKQFFLIDNFNNCTSFSWFLLWKTIFNGKRKRIK